MISDANFAVVFTWTREVSQDCVHDFYRSAFLRVVDRFLRTYLDQQDGANKTNYQLLTLGCMRAVILFTSENTMDIELQQDLCCHIYSREQLMDTNRQFLTWLIETTAQTSVKPGAKKKILHQNHKNIVFLTKDHIVVKCMSHSSATIEVLSQSLLPRDENNNIVTLLGGTILDEDTVELYYNYLPVPMWPASFSRSHEVRVIIGDVIRGLQILHGAGLAHRNLKFSNIRLTDEGRATILNLDGASYGNRCSNMGTYDVPESLHQEVYGGPKDRGCDQRPLDMWALGVLALEMAQGYSLSISDGMTARTRLNILGDEVPVLLSNALIKECLGTELFGFIEQCVSFDPSLRPSVEDGHFFDVNPILK